MASSSSANRDQKRRDGKKVVESEEIVRHMSNLPSFLERGKPIQDKALNFGVMEWGRLEQWQYHRQKQGHGLGLGLVGINKYSLPSSSNSSFLFSTSNSSPHSSKGQSSPPHHVTLQSHLNVSPQGISSRDDSSRRNKPRRSCKTNDLLCVSESNSFDDLGSFQTASSSSSSLKGKMKIQDELVNEPENSYDPKNNIPFERNPTTPCQNTQENKELSVSWKNSNIKSGTTITASKQRSVSPRHRQTPLRKLIDPFIVSKPTSSGQHTDSTFEDSKVKAKVKLDFGSCKEVKVGDSSRKESPKQALFQMAIKNGRPLFTFTVDDKDDILAATVRSLSGKDDANTWIYTFFTIQEVKKKKKKKGGWLTKGAAGQGFLPNVTAQMKVTDGSVINCREFVLSSLGQPILDDVQLEEDELAAIVVQFLRNEEGFSMTVILPGGHHSVPSKGEPSPLIERWRSGGACDCGGWDMGCRLRTLANSNHMASPKFDLFFQGNVVSERPFFTLSSLKEGIFSVQYDSSLSLVHAFSICISVMECRKSSDDTQLKTYVAKQVDDDDDDDPVVKYASLPPVSPVGRV